MTKIRKEVLLADLDRVTQITGDATVKRRDYDKYGRFSSGPCLRIWKSWQKMQEYCGYEITRDYTGNAYTTANRRRVRHALRRCVLSRDDFKCVYCGASPKQNPIIRLQIDHIIPVSRGGKSVLENLQTLCEKCNYTKGAKQIGDNLSHNNIFCAQ